MLSLGELLYELQGELEFATDPKRIKELKKEIKRIQAKNESEDEL